MVRQRRRAHQALTWEWLLDPLSSDEFLRSYWETRPLLLRRARPDAYHELFSMRDAEILVASCAPQSDELRMVRQGKYASVGGRRSTVGFSRVDLDSVSSAWHAGFSINVNEVQARCPSVARLQRALQERLAHRVNVNMYLSPPSSTGFDCHYDVHDVFILQIEGRKRWRVFPPLIELPLDSQPGAGGDMPDPTIEGTLGPGDLLYLPRGWCHEASSLGAPSLHLTVGVNVRRWVDLAQKALTALAVEDVRFRRALPPGYLAAGADALEPLLRGLLDALAKRPLAEPALEALAADLVATTSPRVDGRFGRAQGRVEAGSVLERLVPCRVVRKEGHVTFLFPGGSMPVPARWTAALRHVAASERFVVSNLPGLSLTVQRRLVERLVEAHVLRVRTPRGTRGGRS